MRRRARDKKRRLDADQVAEVLAPDVPGVFGEWVCACGEARTKLRAVPGASAVTVVCPMCGRRATVIPEASGG